jgi:tripartite-type tricarboxylate transporter receptor subunit TctC
MKYLNKLLAVLVLFGYQLQAPAQNYPDRPIKMIIANAPGGGTDNTGRIIAQQLSKDLGQAVIIENHAGAGGVIGVNIAAKAPADGYSILYDSASFAVNPAIRKLPYDPAKDFIPLSLSVSQPNVLVVSEQSPYKTFQDFLKAAKANPGKLTFGSAGVGTGQHMTGELFKIRAKVDMLHVPYKAGAAVYTDIMGGQITCYFGNLGSAMSLIRSGKVRALAVTSPTRDPKLPDVPTMIEEGFPGFEVLEWAGAHVQRGTPPAIVDRLAKAFQAALLVPSVRVSLERAGVNVLGSSQQEFTQFLQADYSRWIAVAKESNIRAD